MVGGEVPLSAFQYAAEAVVNEAQSRWLEEPEVYVDDITVLLIPVFPRD